MDTPGARLRTARLTAGLSVADVAAELMPPVSARTYRKWEADERGPRRLQRKRLVELLEVAAFELWTPEENLGRLTPMHRRVMLHARRLRGEHSYISTGAAERIAAEYLADLWLVEDCGHDPERAGVRLWFVTGPGHDVLDLLRADTIEVVNG